MANKISLWLLMSASLTVQAFFGQAANATEVNEVIDSQVNSQETYIGQVRDFQKINCPISSDHLCSLSPLLPFGY